MLSTIATLHPAQSTARRWCWIATVLLLAVGSGPLAAEQLDFNRDVRPILSDKCFQCHGPDEDKREAELRLDTAEGLFEDRGGYAAVTPGKLDESEAWQRITSDDESLKMPPAEANKELSAEQVEVIRQWIEQGGTWESHWAFVAPERPELPSVTHADWPQNEIDYFILARIEQAGLEPSPPADPYTLVRRVYLDLIGLPPTPEQAEHWVAALNAEPGNSTVQEAAWSELVDMLLSSEHYGERWARRWLDLARYADTNGYEKDRERSIWPYRDWVIRALNRDMPFDQFTIEQLAGDLLPDATVEQRTATGFHRNTMLNEEGGIDPLEFRFYAMTDRVATTGTTWLGLTIECAQCHTHKYDPITHRDYYQLMAFLNNADELDLELPSPTKEAEYTVRLQEADELLTDLPQQWPAATEEEREQVREEHFQAWLREQHAQTVPWTSLPPLNAESNLPFLAIQDDHSIYVSGDTTKHDVYRVEYDVSHVEEPVLAIRLEALPDPRLPANGPGTTFYEGTKGDFFLGEIEFQVNGEPVKIREATESFAANRFGKNPVSAELATDGDLQTGWSVHGRQGERHTAVFVLESPLDSAKRLNVTMHFGRHYSSSLGRFRLSVTSAEGAGARDIPSQLAAALLTPAAERSADQQDALRRQFLLTAPELAEPAEQIRQLHRKPDLDTTLVFQERPAENPRPTYIHHRGEFLQPTEQVQPGVLTALHALPPEAPTNRLTFARWLVDPANPLTARVTVNREWSAFFGEGLVRTLADFGFQGESPSHPQLLDWLATEFMAHDWSLKQLHRRIVTSATYRQASHVQERHLQVDPDNRLLARSPRFRLEAEVVRDATLHAAGVLSLKLGGPPVRPPQPAGVTEAAYGSPKWNADQGEDRFRRSIYTFIKRTAPFAMYRTFDAPSGEACVARRDVSNTALQALTLLNDVMFQEAAQALGAGVASREAADEDKIRFAFRRILTRPPTDDELAAMRNFVQTQRARAEEGTLAVDALSGAEGATAEQAVWTSLTRALLALDEAVTRN